MKFVGTHDVQQWFANAQKLSEFTEGIGRRLVTASQGELGVPDHLQFLIQHLVDEEEDLPANALSSIPFHSLCRGLFPAAVDAGSATHGIHLRTADGTAARRCRS